MKLLYSDTETFSPVPINHGTHRYAEQAEVMLWPFAIDDGEPEVWDLTTGEPMPAHLAAALDDPDVMTVWHNGGMFDLVVLHHALGIHIPIERMHDTMVQALAHSMPGALGQLCEILGVDSDKAKDKRGRSLINLFCRPRPKNMKLRRATRETHPEDWQAFKEYAASDISAMREVHKRLPKWNLQPQEVALWQLDQRINNRGMCIDVEFAEAALRAIDREQARLAKETHDLTDGYVTTATQRDKMLEFIAGEHGVMLEDLRGATVDSLLKNELDPALTALLGVRQQASKTSTSKYKALLNAVSTDGRLRGTKQFCGANRTGRWAGRVFQPDNLPRPTMSSERIEAGIDAVKADCADMLFDNVMDLTSSALRGVIVASPGKKLVVSDLSNIEGRGLAWLAQEHWLLDAFRAFDEGEGPDLYKLTYAKAFGVDPADVTKDQRQIGKIKMLAMGYAGGASAFVTFAAAYAVDLDKMAEAAWPNLPGDVVAEAESFIEWQSKQKDARPFPASRRAHITCEVFKRLWRAAHPRIVTWWKELEDAFRAAVARPGTTIHGTNFKARRDGQWLRFRLPSGRFLCYPGARVDEDGTISYMGVNQFNRKWQRIRTYSGKIAENMTQAFARDVLAGAMLPAENAGYELILHVHDELVTETPNTDEYTVDELSAILATPPDWAPDIPLAAAGFEAMRYGKD